MQKDAIDRLGLDQLLLEPEVLSQTEVDVNLVSTLLSLKNVIPSKTKETARTVVKQLVDQLLKKLLKKHGMEVFGYYRVALAVIVAALRSMPITK